jgi:hypothetical protein
MKILAWNIKFFAKSRIVGQTETRFDATENRRRTKNDAARALQSLTYIISTVRRADPDVFVVIEPRASQGTPGTLADSDSGGPAGLIQLLANLRSTLGANWFLVPPQRINTTQIQIDPIEGEGASKYTECIGVFWNSNKVTFTGPWVNTAAGPANAGVPVTYAAPYDNVVPPGMTLSGCASFGLLGFPELTSRRPFLTTFTEIAAPQRLLELYSVHSDTYQGARAAEALRKLQFVDIHNKIIMLAGDFNVNVSAPDGKGYLGMNMLFQQGFARLYPGPIQQYITQFPSFGLTMIHAGPDAMPGAYKKPETFDFALVHLGINAGDINNSKCEVIDRVAGTPPNIGRAMSYPLADFTRSIKPLSFGVFRDRFNYAKIGTPAKLDTSPAVFADGTSDHLPILVTV